MTGTLRHFFEKIMLVEGFLAFWPWQNKTKVIDIKGL